MYGGFIRDIDKAGRIVIPKQLRKELGINYEGAVVEMFYDGKQIIIEAEEALYKNAYSLSSKSDQSTADISPSSASNAIINHIGGTTWNSAGSKIAWKVDVPKDGLYKLGIAFKQSFVIGAFLIHIGNDGIHDKLIAGFV